jgi:general secretion pathway protein G
MPNHAFQRARAPARRRAPERNAGFTLLELLVVMVIIGLLVGYVAPNYFSAVGKSEVKAARAQIDALHKALVAYRLDMGAYPPSDPGLNALVQKPAGATQWAGPYLSKTVPLDPWGHPYVYRFPGRRGGEFDLLSYGRDGKPGGEGEAADISD